MAIENAKTFNVRIRNKYDSYESWIASSLVLEAGEIAIAYTTVDVKVENGTAKHPALLMKVGDGEKTFAELPWLSAKAADVLEQCKSSEALTEFINSVIADAGIASDDAMQALAGRVTANEGEIAAIKGLVGEVSVATQIVDAIEAALKVDGEEKYALKAHKHEIVDVNGLEDAIADAKQAGTDANAALEAYKATNDVAVQANADAIVTEKERAEGIESGLDARLQTIEAKFGDGEGNVESQIAAAVAVETALREAADAGLQEQITANDGEILALQNLVGETSVAEQIADEAEIARAAEKANADAIDAIEADYLKAADKTELQDQITTNANAIELLTNGVSSEEVDGVNDLIQYVKDHGTEVTGIKADIKANADAIDVIEADYLKAADKTELQGAISSTQGEVDALETEVATKAAQADLVGVADRVETLENALNTETTGLTARMGAAEDAIVDLKGLVGETGVVEQIADALEAANLDQYATDEELSDAVSRISTVEGKVTTLEGEMDTAQADIDALETEIVKKANDADLAAVAKSGLIDDLSIGEGTVLVFDCGDSNF